MLGWLVGECVLGGVQRAASRQFKSIRPTRVTALNQGPHEKQSCHLMRRRLKLIEDLVRLAEELAVETDRDGAFPAPVVEAFLRSGYGGLLSTAEQGGWGGTIREASAVVARLAEVCGSTAMIVAMHYCGAAAIDRFGTLSARSAVASGSALTTLAFSERGSRSQFWNPVSTARRAGDMVILDAKKSWITSVNHAHLFVWSSRGTSGEGVSLWLVPAETRGLVLSPSFDGLGLRGNESGPALAERACIPSDNLLGEDGSGLDIMLGTILPVFCILNASVALGIARGALAGTLTHANATRFEHLDQPISSFPGARDKVGRMQLHCDMAAAFIEETIKAVEGSSDAQMLRVLEVKAAASEAVGKVTDLAMSVCGGAAFRKDLGIERFFRDARAHAVMAPTSDQLYDFIGRASCGLELFS